MLAKQFIFGCRKAVLPILLLVSSSYLFSMPKSRWQKSASQAELADKVDNMEELFEYNDFGEALKECSEETKLIAIAEKSDSQLYKIAFNDMKSEYGLRKGDVYYLDKHHKDHIEVFRKGQCVCVLNLDGSNNNEKTELAFDRSLKLKKSKGKR